MAVSESFLFFDIVVVHKNAEWMVMIKYTDIRCAPNTIIWCREHWEGMYQLFEGSLNLQLIRLFVRYKGTKTDRKIEGDNERQWEWRMALDVQSGSCLVPNVVEMLRRWWWSTSSNRLSCSTTGWRWDTMMECSESNLESKIFEQKSSETNKCTFLFASLRVRKKGSSSICLLPLDSFLLNEVLGAYTMMSPSLIRSCLAI